RLECVLSTDRHVGSNPTLSANLTRSRSFDWRLGSSSGFERLASLAALGTNPTCTEFVRISVPVGFSFEQPRRPLTARGTNPLALQLSRSRSVVGGSGRL